VLVEETDWSFCELSDGARLWIARSNPAWPRYFRSLRAVEERYRKSGNAEV